MARSVRAGVGSNARAQWATGTQITMGVLVALMVASTIAFILSVYMRPPGDVLLWADLFLYSAPMLLASVLALIRALRGGEDYHPWAVIAAGMLIYVVGNVLYSLEDQLTLPDIVPSLPDLLWMAFYPLAFIGVVLLIKRRFPTTRGYAWLDSLVVGVGVFAIGTAVVSNVIALHLTAEAASELVVNSLYLSGDLVLIALAAMVFQSFGGRPPIAWTFLTAGFVAFAVADGFYLMQVALGSYVEGAWLDAFWPLSGLFIGLAAWLDTPRVPQVITHRRLAFIAPSITILAAAAVLTMHLNGPLYAVAATAGVATIVLAVVRLNIDVRESIVLTAQLRRSRVDNLTGLPNRRGLLEIDQRGALPVSLILIDIDAFKDVNDTMGHSVGDRLLETTADRLRERVGASHVLARMGGDEFGVLAWGASAESASKIAESLLVALERPLVLDGVPLFVTACAGVAHSSDPDCDLQALFREAEVALYTAKSDGPGLVRTHDGRTGEQTAARLRMRAELREDLAAGGDNFVLHYQPIVSLGDGSLLATEALVRWHHDGRLVPPGVFLPEVIRAGQMPELTRFVLRRSLQEMKGLPWTVPVTVNVPPDLMGPWIVDEAMSALRDLDIPPDHLIVEITEEAIIRNPEEVASVLMTLREAGVRSLLDDFGSGWSGLASLRDFIVDGLKIDGSFVARMTTDSAAMAIVHGVIGLADELGMVVICEGAEDPETIEVLKGFDRAYVQGFSMSRPMPIEDMSRWMILGHLHRHPWDTQRRTNSLRPSSNPPVNL